MFLSHIPVPFQFRPFNSNPPRRKISLYFYSFLASPGLNESFGWRWKCVSLCVRGFVQRLMAPAMSCIGGATLHFACVLVLYFCPLIKRKIFSSPTIRILFQDYRYRLVSIWEVSSNIQNHDHDDKDVTTVPMLKDTTKQAEKPHICTECDKGFSKKCNLNRHLSTHTGSKPFSCHLCDYTFALKHELGDHMRIILAHRRVLSTSTYTHTHRGKTFLLWFVREIIHWE